MQHRRPVLGSLAQGPPRGNPKTLHPQRLRRRVRVTLLARRMEGPPCGRPQNDESRETHSPRNAGFEANRKTQGGGWIRSSPP